jgi:hypothetical protein
MEIWSYFRAWQKSKGGYIDDDDSAKAARLTAFKAFKAGFKLCETLTNKPEIRK